MSDDRIIDFNNLRNKAKDTDVDKFEQYIYNLYFSVMDGSLSMAEFSKRIFDYMRDNNISYEKFMNIQKKFMERYGMNPEEVENQLKGFGIDSFNMNFSEFCNTKEPKNKNIDFNTNNKEKTKSKEYINSFIRNDVNDIEIIIDESRVILISDKKINLVDAELNEFLLSYKNKSDKKIKIILCENSNEYDY